MVLVDANVLLYAVNPQSPQHERCRGWLSHALGEVETVGFAWTALLGFVRLSTKPRIFPRPLTLAQAFGLIDTWLAQPAALVVHPTDQHASTLRALLESVGTAGNLTSDAHLAALALTHGATVVSCDADFRRFRDLATLNPLD